MGGLVSVDSPGIGITTTGAGASNGPQAPSSGRSGAGPGRVSDTPIENSLDQFFASTSWTREDVLVMAAILQIIAWGILLYHEVAQ